MHEITPFEAAIPAWRGLVMVPKLALIPEPRLAAIPMAYLSSSSPRPISLPAAAEAPNVPMVAVEWKPLL